jgi:hypothetical protein
MEGFAVSGYLRPCDAPISASWADHRNRNPPSSEPGTDYACAYGTPILAAASGVVADLSRSTNGGTGRYVAIDLDDGRRTRDLHLSEVWVDVGTRVARGQSIAASGASGFGSNWGYGAHVHRTLFPRHAYDFGSTLDFEAYVGDEPTPAPPDRPTKRDEDMQVLQLSTWDGGGLHGVCYAVSPGAIYVCRDIPEAQQLAAVWNDSGTITSVSDQWMNQHLDANGIPRESLYNAAGVNWSWAKDAARDTDPSDPHGHSSHPLVGPAWVGGVLLGLIGLVEVVRLVVDLLT